MSTVCQTTAVGISASKSIADGVVRGIASESASVSSCASSAPASDKGHGASPLLHNVGGPPLTRLTWDGLAPTSSASRANDISASPGTGYIDRSAAIGHDQQTHTAGSLDTPKFWLTVWARRRWLGGLPRSEGSDAVVTRKIESLARHLVAQSLLPPVALVSIEKPSAGLIHTLDNDWLLWVLKAKRASNVWMLTRPVHLGHIGTRGKDFPCPDPDTELFPKGQGPIWVHLPASAIHAIAASVQQWEGI